MADVLGDQFGTCDHNFNTFKIVMEKGSTGQKIRILNWGKANFDGITQELEVHWERLFADKETSGL